MEVQKKKKRIVNSSAVIISIGLHAAMILLLGGMVVLKLYKKKSADFHVEEQRPKLERRQLQMPVKTQPFIEQMSKPRRQTTSRITANTPRMVNIPEQGEYVKQAPMPTFRNAYTNFVQMDRTLQFNSKYRDVSMGISEVDFFGTRGKAEKVVVVVDASRSILQDSFGGVESYQMVVDDLQLVVENMRPATLFNVVLFDDEKVSLFNQTLIPATTTAKTNVLQWIGGINTNMAQPGLAANLSNFSPKQHYDMPMEPSDLTGWIKGFQAAAEMKPEIIFVLSSNWGGVTDPKSNLSYFLRQAAYTEYQRKRADYFLKEASKNRKKENAMDEYLAEYDRLRRAALKMLELENQVRDEIAMQPKVVRDWDDILYENDAEFPDLPLAEEPNKVGMSPVETRYTFDEVLESLFVILVNNYRQDGLPKLNFVLFSAKRPPRFKSRASSDTTTLRTTFEKFKELAKIFDGRFRILQGLPAIDNLLRQDVDEVADMLEAEEQEGI